MRNENVLWFDFICYLREHVYIRMRYLATCGCYEPYRLSMWLGGLACIPLTSSSSVSSGSSMRLHHFLFTFFLPSP